MTIETKPDILASTEIKVIPSWYEVNLYFSTDSGEEKNRVAYCTIASCESEARLPLKNILIDLAKTYGRLKTDFPKSTIIKPAAHKNGNHQ